MDIFQLNNFGLVPESGQLLIAEPFMKDSTFTKTVVLLAECIDKGAVGFLLNKPAGLYLHDIIEDINHFEGEIFIGGPVERDHIYFLHNKPDAIPNSVHIADDLYWGGDFEVIKILINEKVISPNDIRFFLGYCGWRAGQLQEEIDDNQWVLHAEMVNKFIFKYTDSNLWEKVLTKKGGKYKIWATIPEDPSVN